jgi:hypothetical protein
LSIFSILFLGFLKNHHKITAEMLKSLGSPSWCQGENLGLGIDSALAGGGRILQTILANQA